MCVETEILCDDCKTVLGELSHLLVNPDGEYVCDECSEQYRDCADCNCKVHYDSPFRDDNNDPICQSCSERYRTCRHCESIEHEDKIYYLGRYYIYVCESCIDDRYDSCSSCNEYARVEDSYALGNGNNICRYCYENGNYYPCESCDDIYSSSELNYDEDCDSGYCNNCYSERQNRSGRIIQYYSYKPDWQYHITSQEMKRNRYPAFYLGIELEVQNTSGGMASNENVAQEIIECAPAICKYDGSISNGFEIVFHPQTYQYAVTDGKQGIERCLSELRSNCFSGHNYGGMHVHVSLSSFTRLHLVKFHSLFINASGLLTHLSQRNHESAVQQWRPPYSART